ncbi:MAG: radical SAM protein, partial [Thermoanaerobaculia bacterium]
MKAAEIRALRPAKEPVDPWRPLGWLREEERAAGGGTEPALTVFLAGAECPFTCVFCDLWRRTLNDPTPRRAIPAQLAVALAAAAAAEPSAPPLHRIKLYNASNFFDPRAVPPEDDPAIAAFLAPFPRVTVECHPRLVGRRCFDFARRLAGRLEVAMGLETVQPEALPRLGKEMTLAAFDRAAAALVAAGIPIRAFV